ncbi:MAG: TraY domain-containing protein [Oscillospiraceae bacterium]|nr:TraY domain-containing protein [Oscillospiraceae bacterium]
MADEYLVRYTLRINRQLFAKFRYVAEYEGRSANREIEQMLKRRVEKFEKEHGEIPVKESDDK